MPFIFVSGTMGEEVAIESLKNGATDYVLKERLSGWGRRCVGRCGKLKGGWNESDWNNSSLRRRN